MIWHCPYQDLFLYLFIPVSLLSVNVGEDCPVFDGLFEFCQLSTGGSIGECNLVNFDQRTLMLLRDPW